MLSKLLRSNPRQFYKLARPSQRAFNSNNRGDNKSTTGNLMYLAAGALVLGGAMYNSKQIFSPELSECGYNLKGSFNDKNLNEVMANVEKGLDGLYEKHPHMPKVKVASGLRGIRYYVEFPIIKPKFDAYSLLQSTQKKMDEGKKNKKYDTKIITTDSYLNDDAVSYLIDYSVKSSKVEGTNCKGTCYIRGHKSEAVDSFKFVVEKNNDFSEFDAELILNAYEQALKPLPQEIPTIKMNGKEIDEANVTPAQLKFAKRQAVKQQQNQQNPQPVQGQPGMTPQEPSQDDNDPVAVLEKHSCSVFMPSTAKDQLTWEYLAGYEKVKRDIEDTVLLALTHGDVYDQITAATRMKNETNRPKCVLFEGPPGCGKTTSAKIISQQVDIPLVYMPLEGIMSKFYGESESKLAEIFEASAAMGSVILFIDEVDSLATSREAGLHEATRRILSTLLRKIDSFESDGEVLVICATNRKKDLDPALISRLDLSIRFELPEADTRAQIFQRYAKQLSQEELQRLGDMSHYLSGRDIADICKDAERKWASKYIRKIVSIIEPSIDVYLEATKNRLVQIQDNNLRMDGDAEFDTMKQQLQMMPMVNTKS